MNQPTPETEESKQKVTVQGQPPNVASGVPAVVIPETADQVVLSPAESSVELPEAGAASPIPKSTAKRYKLKIFILLIVLLNIGVGAANGRLYVHKQQAHTAALASNDERNLKPLPVSASKSSANAVTDLEVGPVNQDPTLHYKSEPLKIEFDYPKDWHVSSSSDNSSINLTSAPFQFTTVERKQSNATINLSLTPSKDNPIFSVNDSDVIAANSENLAYAAPTKQQRTVTNVSFINQVLAAKGSISAAFISGNLQYKQGDKVGTQNYKSVDPQIYLYVDDCASGQCGQASVADNFTIEDWHNNPNFKKVAALIVSLRFN